MIKLSDECGSQCCHTYYGDTKQFSTHIWNNLGKELGGGSFPLRTNRGGGEDIANIHLEEI